MQAVVDHISGKSPLSKERAKVIAAVLADPAEKAAVMAALKASMPALKAAVETAAAGAQTDATEAKRLSANAAFTREYNKSAAKRQLETTVANAARNKRK
jgi:hypothetical protein